MNLLVLGTPNTQEVKWILEEAHSSGYKAEALSLYDIRMSTGKNEVQVESEKTDILDYDVYLFRGISRHLWEALLLAEWLYSKGKVVIDERLATKRYIPSKASTSFLLARHGIPQPKTIIPMGRSEALNILKNIKYPLILKDAWGRQGRRVYLAKNLSEATKHISDFQKNKIQYLIQEYIPVNFDTRVFVVGDKALGGMKRTAPEDDFRSNLSIGGSAESVTLSPEIAKLAVNAAKASFLEIAGVDILSFEGKDYVLETNRCPQFRGFQPSTGVNVGKAIVEYAATRLSFQRNR